MKIKFDPIIIFVFGLVAGVILSPLLKALPANAQTSERIDQVSPSTFSFDLSSINGGAGGANSTFFWYKGVYPDPKGNIGSLGATAGPTYDGTRAELLVSMSKNQCTIVSTNRVTCNVENMSSSTGDGSYWLYFFTPNFEPYEIEKEWYQINRTGGVWSTDYTPVQGSNNVGFAKKTRFLSLTATSTATVATTSPIDLAVDISWFLEASEINRSVSALNPTGIKIKWVETGVPGSEARTFSIASTTGTSSDEFIISDFPSDGAFTFLVNFTNLPCDLGVNACPFPDSYIYFDLLLENGIVSSSTIPELYDTQNVIPEQETCSITNITACINNALIYLFIPSGTALNSFLSLGDRLDTVKPFGYFTQALEAIGGISTSTPAYTMPDIPFQNEIFDPLKTGMSVILWGVFAFVFYNKRLKNIDI